MPDQNFKTRSPWMAASVAIVFALLFLLLRSQQYMAVDGALRCLGVFHDPSKRVHGNNHMLYPFWIWLWTQGAALIGFTAPGWLAYVRLCQAMNAFCAAAAIGMLFTVLEAIAGTSYALLGSLQFGLTTAVVMHATNSAEPVTGLLFSVSALGVLIPALRAESKAGLFLVGVLLTLALASYQAMALVMPVVAFACVCWPGTRWRRAAIRLTLVGAGGVFSVIAVYGLAYSSLEIPARRMLARFLTLDGGSQVYGGFKASKLLNSPFGLIRSLFDGLPAHYAGIRWLLSPPHAAFWIPAIAVSLILLAALAYLGATSIVAGVRGPGVSKSLLTAGISLTALAVAFPLFYWDPLYDKLWLLPLAMLAIAAAFAFRFSRFQPTRQRILATGLVVLVIVEAAVNLPHAIKDHVRETAHLSEARDLSAIVNTRDSVVLDFDDVSMLWLAIWGYGEDTLVLPAATRRETVEWLSNAERNGTAKGGALLFVSVLDHDRTAWDAFLGRATGIPYAEFECYRKKSMILRRYPYSEGSMTVRQLHFPFACSSGTSLIGTPETSQ